MTMLFQVLSVLPLLGVVLSAAVTSHHASICHDLDCPNYTVMESNHDYELRQYEATTWVSVTKEAAVRDDVNSQMFMTLFQYIDGQNANHVKIAMTAPVLTEVVHGQGPNCASNFTMHFMIPHSQWTSPIPPTNPAVSVVTTPQMQVYVRSFGGWAVDADYQRELQSLFTSLDNKNISVDTSLYFDAGYDGPYQFAHRHNEVWLRKM